MKMQPIKFFISTLFSTILMGCSITHVPNDTSLLIEICSVEGLVDSTMVEIIKKNEGFESRPYCQDNQQCLQWNDRTSTGEPVIHIRKDSMQNVLVVNGLIWNIDVDKLKIGHWTDWELPQNITTNEYFAFWVNADNRTMYRPVSELDHLNFKVRFKLMPLNSISDTSPEIPSCK
ncbi:hypothetical protein OCF84_21540 (plasmid) [Shewanella xiamenensis]|uniref:Lipoprotein n=1 Tax=Shewanella xiamenensis TaxID=332186 RepID=A0ABT6UDJ5_9GAMM|nr:hypothetical protein [Shewanella xiamenensis]MDI5832539.1 hypothetical protein [Shewanella xiamenensis]WHF57843.1 hypothetical protein OCF84_21540 [Shewanella xiamenensis]